MPVRKFYANTFGDLINSAMFELKKQQNRPDVDNTKLFTKEGSIQFVAQHLLDHLPEGERRAVDSDSD